MIYITFLASLLTMVYSVFRYVRYCNKKILVTEQMKIAMFSTSWHLDKLLFLSIELTRQNE